MALKKNNCNNWYEKAIETMLCWFSLSSEAILLPFPSIPFRRSPGFRTALRHIVRFEILPPCESWSLHGTMLILKRWNLGVCRFFSIHFCVQWKGFEQKKGKMWNQTLLQKLLIKKNQGISRCFVCPQPILQCIYFAERHSAWTWMTWLFHTPMSSTRWVTFRFTVPSLP